MHPFVRRLGVSLAILALLVGSGAGVGAAARSGRLIPVAFPFALALILVLRRFGAPAERWGWAAFTLWLGSTYLATGGSRETVALAAYGLAGVLGAVWSPYILAAAWLLHPVWDFVPRTLPVLLTDLPTACLLFDIPIGAYLAWEGYRGRWAARQQATTR